MKNNKDRSVSSQKRTSKGLKTKKHQKSDPVKSMVRGLTPILRRLAVVQKQAKKLGIFTNDRELLDCPKCSLKEDVAVSGMLMTYTPDNLYNDTGLRFRELGKGRFQCPSCKTAFLGG